MLKRLAKKEICGDSIDEVVGICTDVGTPTLYYYNNPLAQYETSVLVPAVKCILFGA